MYSVARAALRLRWALIPYLYSMAWRNHLTACPLVMPMYYPHPEDEAAYRAPSQYWFGSELIAAPYTSPRDPDTRLAAQAVWLPDRATGSTFSAGNACPVDRWHTFYGTLADTPVVARAGAIVPLAGGEPGFGEPVNPAALEVHLFPGADNAFELYEDDGAEPGLPRGAFLPHAAGAKMEGERVQPFSVSPAEGERSLVPARREYRLALHGVARPDEVTARVNGAEVAVDWEYGETSEEVRVEGIVLSPADALELRIAIAGGFAAWAARPAGGPGPQAAVELPGE